MTDFAITPDGRFLIAVGQPGDSRGAQSLPGSSRNSMNQGHAPSISGSSLMPDYEPFDLPLGMYSVNEDLRAKRTQMVIYDLSDGSRRAYVSSNYTNFHLVELFPKDLAFRDTNLTHILTCFGSSVRSSCVL